MLISVILVSRVVVNDPVVALVRDIDGVVVKSSCWCARVVPTREERNYRGKERERRTSLVHA